jgi:diguanylate cyclase
MASMSRNSSIAKPDSSNVVPRIKRARNAREWLDAFRCEQEGQLALMLVGIKDLSQINDRYGRANGDAVIQQVGQNIAQFVFEHFPNVELVARMPGRDFLIILQGPFAAKQLAASAKKLLDALSGDFGAAATPVTINPRIGIAIAAREEEGFELLYRARTALSFAYSRKGERIDFADYQSSADLQIKNAIDAGLRGAIAKRRITIMLQPQFEVATGRLVGAEALTRLQNKDLGEIGAVQLFAAADRCDLREELSDLIQRSALAIAAAWPAALSNLRLAVNLGAGELDESFSVRMFGLLNETGFDAGRLTLEVTEESLIRDIDKASEQLTILREHKIQVAVDDFGTGYSSLAYLKTLPLDYLKIDKGMTPDIIGTGKDRIVLRAIIAMAKALELKIIAEGVEREEELEMLKIEGCDYFQGYLKSRPSTAEAFERFALRSN